MCESCWNADAKETKEACKSKGNEPFIFTFEQMKEKVIQKWVETGMKNFRVIKDVIFNPPNQSYTWEATQFDHNGTPLKKADLSIQIV